MNPDLTTEPGPPGWLTAQAPWPRGVQAGITLRTGGVSQAPCDSFNLGDHVGDDDTSVQTNRQNLTEKLGARLVFCRQVHGTEVLPLGPETPNGEIADGAWTQVANLACTMMVADCLPILLAAPDGSSVAALHAGWRGLAGERGLGVVEALCKSWPAVQTEAQRSDSVVWLGPCIGPTHFEVGAEVRDAFLSSDGGAAGCFQPLKSHGAVKKYLANLPLLARRRLEQAGFGQVHGNDGSSGWCTVLNGDRFFSFRRDQASLGATGRMAACIWRG